MEIETSTGPAVLWLRARQLCYLGGHAPQSGEIIDPPESKDGMPADLADTLKADEEDRKTDLPPLIQVKADEVAIVTATIETNLQAKLRRRRRSRRRPIVLVPDPIVSAPWSVLFGRSEPSTGGATLAMRATARRATPSCSSTATTMAGSEERQKSRAEERRTRSLLKKSSPHSIRKFLWPCDSRDRCAQRRRCGWLAKTQTTARVDVPTAPQQCCCFFF